MNWCSDIYAHSLEKYFHLMLDFLFLFLKILIYTLLGFFQLTLNQLELRFIDWSSILTWIIYLLLTLFSLSFILTLFLFILVFLKWRFLFTGDLSFSRIVLFLLSIGTYSIVYIWIYVLNQWIFFIYTIGMQS
jgi:hypothetical protein